MAQFINAVGSGGDQPTPGERRFGERLRTHLEDDYLCWHNVPVGPRRQYPDFVTLHPRHGLWIFEVKDWRLDSLRMIGNHHVELHTATGGVKTIANPLHQARQYALAIVNKLSTDPQLQDPAERYRGRICFPYAWCAVLTNITRRQLREVLTEEEQELVLPERLILCKDEMLESTPPDVFQEKLWGMFHYRFGQPLSLPQIERVRWHLFPQIRITSVQRDFFATSPEDTDEEPIPELIKVMDLQQEHLARNLGDGHRVVHGVAGSGKTLILGYRCLHLARVSHKPVLVLCFNITLAARLRAFVESNAIEDRVRVHHFHEWCKTQIDSYHLDVAGTGKIWDRQVESVITGVDRGLVPRGQYGAILIDEGHDFQPEWLRLVAQMVDPATDSLLLLYDSAQSIYKRKGRFSLSSVGIKAQGRTTILRLNYRNTREILAFAYDFASSFLPPEEADDDHIPLIRPEAAGLSGPVPAFRFRSSPEEEIAYAVECVRKWSDHGTPLSEIALLSCDHRHGALAAAALKRAGIPAHWMAHRHRKKSYDPRRDCVAILPIPSSKGLEFKSVIVLGTGHIDAKTAAFSDNVRLLYVAMTRAKEHLLLTASSRNTFTEHLEKLAA